MTPPRGEGPTPHFFRSNAGRRGSAPHPNQHAAFRALREVWQGIFLRQRRVPHEHTRRAWSGRSARSPSWSGSPLRGGRMHASGLAAESTAAASTSGWAVTEWQLTKRHSYRSQRASVAVRPVIATLTATLSTMLTPRDHSRARPDFGSGSRPGGVQARGMAATVAATRTGLRGRSTRSLSSGRSRAGLGGAHVTTRSGGIPRSAAPVRMRQAVRAATRAWTFRVRAITRSVERRRNSRRRWRRNARRPVGAGAAGARWMVSTWAQVAAAARRHAQGEASDAAHAARHAWRRMKDVRPAGILALGRVARDRRRDVPRLPSVSLSSAAAGHRDEPNDDDATGHAQPSSLVRRRAPAESLL